VAPIDVKERFEVKKLKYAGPHMHLKHCSWRLWHEIAYTIANMGRVLLWVGKIVV
jgi:hypothetical protein